MKGKRLVALTICLWSESKLRSQCSGFYMSKIGDSKEKVEIREDVLKKGKALSSLLKMHIFNCLSSSL